METGFGLAVVGSSALTWRPVRTPFTRDEYYTRPQRKNYNT